MYFTAKRNPIHETATRYYDERWTEQTAVTYSRTFFTFERHFRALTLFGEKIFDTNSFCFSKYSCIQQKVLLINRNTQTPNSVWHYWPFLKLKKLHQYLLVGVLIPTIFHHGSCLRQMVKTFSMSSACLDSDEISLFFSIPKRKS